MVYNQQEFNIRTEWAIDGINQLAEISDVIIIVDILSFSTCVDIATNNGAVIFPYFYKDRRASEYALSNKALLANTDRKKDEYSLSPQSLLNIKSQTRLVLPSPNGSNLSLNKGNCKTICGSIRNAKSVAEYAMTIGTNISVIPAGEHWENGNVRFSFEDLLGAGAIINYLRGSLSPESLMAKSVFENTKDNIFLQRI